MAITLSTASANTAFSFGIYDESGKLVVSSGLIEVKASVHPAPPCDGITQPHKHRRMAGLLLA